MRGKRGHRQPDIAYSLVARIQDELIDAEIGVAASPNVLRGHTLKHSNFRVAASLPPDAGPGNAPWCRSGRWRAGPGVSARSRSAGRKTGENPALVISETTPAETLASDGRGEGDGVEGHGLLHPAARQRPPLWARAWASVLTP